MAGQQQQIIDTIFSMKRKLLRGNDSDLEEADSPFANYRQDLKRKSQYARASDPDFLSDPRPYKKRVEHGGYRRYILQRNPPRYDPDGDIVEPSDEYEDEDDLEAVEENPYADIRLERLLRPLTSAADLPTHRSLSVPYTSKHLTNLANEAGALWRREQITIARAKQLFVKLQGDSDFAPAALAAMADAPLGSSSSNGTAQRVLNGGAQPTAHDEARDMLDGAQDIDMEDARQLNGLEDDEARLETGAETVNGTATNGTAHEAGTDGAHQHDEEARSAAGDDASDDTSQAAHRMTTRARAQAASTPSPPHSPSSLAGQIHPLFLFSTDSLPDRDFGLPPNEAEETRMLLMAYVQKQEEISRATSDLYHGLMQADSMRQDVFTWCKAEAHIGEMSDGEDWCDNEYWGLDHDLVKDDVVVAGLNPSEDYKTSVLSGLSPTLIMECASRSLAFHSYQTSQEIVYQEHLAKGLTEKYNVLSQQMDQLIHDANTQIKLLQDKVQAQQVEEDKLLAQNTDLSNGYRDKARALQRQKKQYDSLKGQVMASHVASAAGDQAELTLQTARGKRFIDRMPGARSGSGAYSQLNGAVQMPSGSRPHDRQGSGSSGSSGLQRGGAGVGPAPTYASHLQGRGLGGRAHPGQSASISTPRQSHLPVLGGTRQGPILNANIGSPYQASPMMQRQTVGGNRPANGLGNSMLGIPRASRRTTGPLQR
ncbi:RXT2-like protein [Boeremia exigua]|uniref:RXT2-like protein n=1 Tax=Boeremia exigua TaxID=749465 RepID=UPI001E8D88A4|nr:RXT2-like protein [Boeremia exigua]KAH6615299.1 RXT2-like protein [Boeremia exigua]